MGLDKLNESIVRIQFVADVALIAQCKSDELQLAMLAREIDTSRLQDAIFNQAE